MYNLEYVDSCLLKETLSAFNIKRCKNKSLKVREIDNAVILSYHDSDYSGDVIQSDGSLLQDVVGYYDYSDRLFNKNIEIKSVCEEPVIYIGIMYNCWGHCVTDCISKLWFLETSQCVSLLNKGVRIVYTPLIGEKISDSLKDLLRLCSIDVDRIYAVDENTKYSKIYIPDNSFWLEKGRRYFTTEYKLLIDKISNQVTPSIPLYEKIYLTRTNFKTPHIEYGERQIEKAFEKLGYKIISPECYSLNDQILILKGASKVATTEGSISHNTIFCKQGTDVLLLRKSSYSNEYQYPIAEVKSLNITYIDAHLSLFVNKSPWLGPFFVYINENLAAYFKSQGFIIARKFSKKKFMDYVLTCMLMVDFHQRNPSAFYVERMQKELSRLSILERIRRKLRKILRTSFFECI